MSEYATRRLRLLLTAFILLSIAASWSAGTTARAAGSVAKRVVILSLEGLTLEDIDPEETPGLHRLFSEGAVGLVGMRKAFNYSNVPSAFYATLGAGAPVAGYEWPARDSTQRMWTRRALFTGDVPDRPRDEWLNARAKAIVEVNEDKRTAGEFGALGRALRENNMVIGAVGSYAGLTFLEAAMDETGRVDKISIVEDESFREGWPDASPNLFAAWVQAFYEESDLTMAAYSDVRRARDGGRPEKEIRQAISRAGSVATQAMTSVSDDDLLIVILPFGGEAVSAGLGGDLISEGEPLTPIATRGHGAEGLLTSGSTRRTGVISITDLQPTIFEALGLEISGTRGMPIAAKPYAGDNLAFVKRTNDYAFLQEAARVPVLAPIAVWVAILLISLLLLVNLGVERGHRARRMLLLSTFMVPPALAVPGVLGASTPTVAIAAVAVTMLLAIPLALLVRSPLRALAAAAGITPVLYLFDLLLGTGIGQGSMLAGSVLKGGRYYGVGNPLMGIILVFTILFVVAVISERPTLVSSAAGKLALAAVLTTVVVGVGGAGLGANFGGLVTLAVAFPLLFFRLALSGRRRNWLWLVFSFGGIILLVLSDVALGSSSQSHIGRMFASLGGNIGSAVQMARFKMAFNLESTKLLLWRLGGVFALAPLVVLIVIGAARLRARLNDFPVFRRALPAVFLGAIITLLVNDTGFEPFLLVLLYTLAAALYLYSSVEAPAPDDQEKASVTNNERMFA